MSSQWPRKWSESQKLSPSEPCEVRKAPAATAGFADGRGGEWRNAGAGAGTGEASDSPWQPPQETTALPTPPL